MTDTSQTAVDAAREAYKGPWRQGNEFLPYHPKASHVPPDHRDGWNAGYWAAIAAQPQVAVPAGMLAYFRAMRDLQPVGEIRHTLNEVCDRMDVLVSKLIHAAPVAGQQDSAPLVERALAAKTVVADKSGNMRDNAAQQSEVKP
jgi:hypothetical protein